MNEEELQITKKSLTTTKPKWKLRILALFFLIGIFFGIAVLGLYLFMIFGGTRIENAYSLGFIIGLFITNLESLVGKLLDKKEKIDISSKFEIKVYKKNGEEKNE